MFFGDGGSGYGDAFLLQFGTALFALYLPVLFAVLIARERVCQHTAAPALCRWSTWRLLAIAVFVVSVFLVPCYILAAYINAWTNNNHIVIYFTVWALFTDAAALLVLVLLLRRIRPSQVR